MKFELEPNNRNCPDAVLLDDLRRVAAALGSESVTKEVYDAQGRFSCATLHNRFGSWGRALEKSGLQVAHPKNIPKQELIEDLKRVASQLGKSTVSTTEYRLHGKFGVSTVQCAFGSWKLALENAGLCISPLYHERATDDELLENIEKVWVRLGRQPRKKDFEHPVSRFCSHTYRNRFGSLRNALEAFVASIQVAEAEDAATTTSAPATTTADPTLYRHKTPREVSWRLRFLVMRRDNFKCVITGRSPATHPGTELVVDHVIPWDAGGETVMENLQTLCREINAGKSNLPMHEPGSGQGQDYNI